MFWLNSFSKYEDALFDRVAHRVICDWRKDDIKYKDGYTISHMKLCKKITNKLEILKKLNTFTHTIMGPPRQSLFRNNKKEEQELFLTKNLNFYTPLLALNNGESCYAHSIVFGRLVSALGFKWRNISMYYNNKNHNVSEVYYKDRWIVFDPLFNQYFVRPDGKLATKEDIHNNWRHYKKQIGKYLLFKNDIEYKYDYDYNYTLKQHNSQWKDYIKRFISFVLGYTSYDELQSKFNLNKFYYWQFKLTAIFIVINVLFGLFYWIYKKRNINEI